MTIAQKREKAESSVQICVKLDIEQFCQSRACHYCKNIEFSWLAHSPLASGAKLYVDMIQMVEISWEPSDNLLSTGQRSFAFRGAKEYNSLPEDIRAIENTLSFKRKAAAHLLKTFPN